MVTTMTLILNGQATQKVKVELGSGIYPLPHPKYHMQWRRYTKQLTFAK